MNGMTVEEDRREIERKMRRIKNVTRSEEEKLHEMRFKCFKRASINAMNVHVCESARDYAIECGKVKLRCC